MGDQLPVSLPGRPALPPLSLYLHFPWCVSKCPYCDFNSHEKPDALPEDEYLAAMRADLEGCAPEVASRTVGSVFIGGGTPSLMEPSTIDSLMSDVRMLVRLLPGAEVTMEANPGTLDRGRFAEFAAAGVNRLSLGIQSFNDESLVALGRIHDARQARQAAEVAIECFERVNLDLMFGLPGQDLEQALFDVRQACSLGVGHMSLYQLTLEPGTRFFRTPPAGMPDPELIADMDDDLRDEIAMAGLARYEVSAHARPGDECAHNLNYWRFGDYLGIGAGAHGKLTTALGVRRDVRHKSPRRYMEKAQAGEPVASSEIVGRSELAFEFMLNALRLTGGFEEWMFLQRTGLPLREIERGLEEARSNRWIAQSGDQLRPTAAGIDFNADLCALFLPKRPKVVTSAVSWQ